MNACQCQFAVGISAYDFSTFNTCVFCFASVDSVTSSEKVDKEHRYSDFSIVSMPYPGCEFFKEWRENSYQAEALMFDWNQVLNDTKIVTLMQMKEVYFATHLVILG